MKKRKLFCEISPLTYQISICKEQCKRHIKNLCMYSRLATQRQEKQLPILVYKHQSLMRRRLGNVRQDLQENKVVNLNLAVKKVTGILIPPKQIFSFWRLVGNCTKRKGYLEGLTISLGGISQGVGGGMCQFTNLIHWMVLHSPLDIVEHHHHDGLDLFPDFGRKVPFGTGTSICYNHLDYRFQNNTDQTFQLIVYTTDEYLCGELRTTKELPNAYHIYVEDEKFVREGNDVYRLGNVFRKCVDKKTGKTLYLEKIKQNHAKVMYDICE